MKVLISGASIAGPAAAYWLARHGVETTVVEQATSPRRGGAPIDIREEAVELVEKMDILDQVREVRGNTRGIVFVDAEGNDLHTMPTTDDHDIELYRGELVRILLAATENDVEYVFGDSLSALHQDEAGVDVEFERGAPRRFDLVLGADGLHSTVRRLTFGPESEFLRHVGVYTAIVPVDPALGRPDHGLMRQVPGKLVGVYSFRGTAMATFMFRSPELSYDYRDLDQQKKILTDAFADQGWIVPRLLADANATDDFYFDSISQVHLPSWSRGRVALIGDAAACPSPLTGMGTSVALLGAAALTEALAEAGHRTAFAEYERKFRPRAMEIQDRVTAGVDLLVPVS
jgi:2-polyprenyl-6-methoxyphenol hydroxylase-like FAD-dependent oxidoreductase